MQVLVFVQIHNKKKNIIIIRFGTFDHAVVCQTVPAENRMMGSGVDGGVMVVLTPFESDDAH